MNTTSEFYEAWLLKVTALQ